MNALGIDVGGSGIKGALVDVSTGALVGERHRVSTPRPATPDAVAGVIAEIARHHDWTGPIGCGFPAVIQRGVARTAANVDASFIGTDLAKLFGERTGRPVTVLNDADAAGLGEVRFGEGKDVPGVVLLVTIGTGLGTAVFTDGRLVPNTEFGHISMHDEDAEHWASDAARKREDLDWPTWGRRFDEVLHRLCELIWPDKIILGGGAAKKMVRFRESLTVDVPVVPASALNQAGIVGAALAATD